MAVGAPPVAFERVRLAGVSISGSESYMDLGVSGYAASEPRRLLLLERPERFRDVEGRESRDLERSGLLMVFCVLIPVDGPGRGLLMG
jgi:hypothetical protein